VDANGNETTDPSKIAALFPFGQHKGYGLSLIDASSVRQKANCFVDPGESTC